MTSFEVLVVSFEFFPLCVRSCFICEKLNLI